MEKLKVGATLTRKVTVDAGRTIDFMGEDCRVYATPSLVRDIEHACRDLIVGLVPAGQDSVGASVNISHTAPTLLGMEATITVTVAEVDGRRVALEVVAQDPLDRICKGRHERFVVDIARTRERLRQKAAAAAAQTGGR